MIILNQNHNVLSAFGKSNMRYIYIYDSETDGDPEYGRYFIEASGTGHCLGTYKTIEQAKYVVEQIYRHILYHDNAYEMPSQEEVENALECIIASQGG